MVRKIYLATAVLAGLACATPATAQRVWQNGRWVSMPQRTPAPAPQVGMHGDMRGGMHQDMRSSMRQDSRSSMRQDMRSDVRANMNMRGNQHRWGPMVNGRWEGGYRAPGGWNAYRRLGRGATLPGYWMGGSFRIDDYLNFGLAAPPQGYGWVRYYDDAVLVDRSGRVWDSVDGIGWADAEADSGYGWSESNASAGDYPPIAPERPEYYDAPPPPPLRAPYPQPQVHVIPAPGSGYYGGTFYGGSATPGTAVYTSGGYGATTTTVVITPAPITTTTIVEEVIQQEVVSTTYVRKPRRVVHRAVRRKVCCTCVCR